MHPARLLFLAGFLSFPAANWCLNPARTFMFKCAPRCVFGCVCDPSTPVTIDGPQFARQTTCRDSVSGDLVTVGPDCAKVCR